MGLRITQIKPNPAGKDKTPAGYASPTQLGAEWVDIKNTGYQAVGLGNVELNHQAYSDSANWTWRAIYRFASGFTLAPNEIVRVHSGSGPSIASLRPEDIAGSTHDVFTGEDRFVWNNREGDTPALWDTSAKGWIDKASYDPYPPEGTVLVRSGDKLMPGG